MRAACRPRTRSSERCGTPHLPSSLSIGLPPRGPTGPLLGPRRGDRFAGTTLLGQKVSENHQSLRYLAGRTPPAVNNGLFGSKPDYSTGLPFKPGRTGKSRQKGSLIAPGMWQTGRSGQKYGMCVRLGRCFGHSMAPAVINGQNGSNTGPWPIPTLEGLYGKRSPDPVKHHGNIRYFQPGALRKVE